jgi:hypothetical protein
LVIGDWLLVICLLVERLNTAAGDTLTAFFLREKVVLKTDKTISVFKK